MKKTIITKLTLILLPISLQCCKVNESSVPLEHIEGRPDATDSADRYPHVRELDPQTKAVLRRSLGEDYIGRIIDATDISIDRRLQLENWGGGIYGTETTEWMYVYRDVRKFLSDGVTPPLGKSQERALFNAIFTAFRSYIATGPAHPEISPFLLSNRRLQKQQARNVYPDDVSERFEIFQKGSNMDKKTIIDPNGYSTENDRRLAELREINRRNAERRARRSRSIRSAYDSMTSGGSDRGSQSFSGSW